MLNEHFNKLLDRVLDTTRTAVEEAGGRQIDMGSLRQRLANDLATGWPTLTSVTTPPWLEDEEDMEQHSREHDVMLRETMSKRREDLCTWPTEDEANKIVPIYSRLSEEARDVLRDYAQDCLESLMPGGVPGMFDPGSGHPVWSELVDAGLIVPIPPPFGEPDDDGRNYYVMSPLGLKVGRLLTARGPRPQYLAMESAKRSRRSVGKGKVRQDENS